jgi:dTDP-4-dehydrorhamnose reductase
LVLSAGPILVTGGSGQLATALMARAGSRNLVLAGRPAFDFDRLEAIPGVLRAAAPSLIINAAAYTAVDKSETDVEAAYRANRDGPRLLAEYAAAAGIPLIHVSTDYVYDGNKGAPYVETDATNPTGVYGASKLAGEEAVLATGARAVILRTSWVYSATGKNFVLTMLNAASRTRHLRVVADQHGCPTAAGDLAAAILRIANRFIASGWQDYYRGVYHAAGSGATTWHGLASAVFAEAAKHGLEPPTVEAIATADWPTPVRRPPDSRLDCMKLGRIFGVALPDWRLSVARTVGEIFVTRK